MSDASTDETVAPAGSVEREIQDFIASQTKMTAPVDRDLFASGLVASLFAMELIVHLEQTYAIAIVGADLKLDNFRTIERMTALVARLQSLAAATGA